MNTQKIFEELLKKKGLHTPIGPALVRRDDAGPFPLSYPQRRIWFLQQFDAKSAAYNDPTALRIKGPLNRSVLEQTLNEIIRRHRVLRMTFQAQDGQPLQSPHPDARLAAPVTSLQTEPGQPLERRISEFVNRFSAQPFDLPHEIPIKAALLEIAEDDYAFVVNIHHIVMDGWSKGIMLDELITLYEAFSRGSSSPFGELPVQYTDYVYWSHEAMQGEVFDSQLTYWKEKLAGAPPLLELPYDHPRPNIPTGGGSWEPFSFPAIKLRALAGLAKQEHATLFMVLITLYSVLLFRYSGREDILIGSPTAGRPLPELEKLIGLFVNTLVIRVDLSGDPGFKTLLHQVRAACLDAYSHQEIPFEKLVEELNPRRNLNVNPVFQVMFQLQNAPMPPAHIAGLAVAPIRIDTGFSQLDLSLTQWEEEGALQGTFEYDTDLFEAETVKRMAGHFQALADGIIADMEQKISLLPIMTEEETRRVLETCNGADVDYPRELCIYRLFEECAAKNPDETAVIFENRRLTYNDLEHKADRLSHFLQALNVRPETLVGICMDNTVELIAGIMGILKAGGAYIPMDPQYPDRRLIASLKDSQSPIVLTQTHHAHRFSDYQGKIIALDQEQDFITEESVPPVPNRSDPGNTACVIYTSGSTGEPKGILIENRSIVNLIYSFIHSYTPTTADRILPITSIASASFVGEILPMLTSGGAVALADKILFLDMKRLVFLLSQYDITILSTAPSMIARLNALSADEWRPGKLRLILSGGEALSAGDIDRLQERIAIVNGYGLTEATICSTYIIVNENRPDFSKNPVISIGKPIINTDVYILDKNQQVVPIGIPGEIYIGGDGLSRGYLNNPELTAERFVSGGQGAFLKNHPLHPQKTFEKSYVGHLSPLTTHLYKTGDLGCLLADGSIKFLGRIDTQVQVRGYRVELLDIETHLGLHPDIQDVAVVDREFTAGDKGLVAYYVPVKDEKVPETRLREWLAERLPEYMIPAAFEKVPAIPLNANGKVDTAALPVPSRDRPELNAPYLSPQNEIEKTIAAAWQEFLHLDKIGINDNFFDLGGHSLLLTQIHSRLNALYGKRKELTIVDMFRYPTIRSLAEYIDDSRVQEQQIADSYRKMQERAEMQRRAFDQTVDSRGAKPPGKL